MLLDCNDASAGEIRWNYGEGYDDIREHAGYAAGEPCAEGLVVPVQNARVEAILAKGGVRVQEALYPLTDDSSQDSSSGDEWLPVKRVVRSSRHERLSRVALHANNLHDCVLFQNLDAARARAAH